MEPLHNLWNVLITEDENLMRYITIIMSVFETYVILKLFTSVLNISYTKKQRNIYFLCMFACVLISTFILPNELSVFFTMITLPIIVKFVFKASIPKSILSELVILLTTLIIESIYIKLCFYLFNISLDDCINIPIYRLPSMIIVYTTIYAISKLVLLIKFNFNAFEHLSKKSKILLILNVFFILICIALQFYLLLFYNNALPIYITLISLVSLIIYACISFYSMTKSINLEITKKELEQTQLHNKTLELLYSNISAFKHDFSNILTALGGFVYTKNLDGLEKYYNKILDECHINNNLSTLNPKIINNPAVYNILATKYYKADELGITINLQFFINLDELKFDIYDFCRILGILLDNSIEAASKCEEKLIIIDIHDVKSQKYQVITIENTYSDKNIDINKISEKGYTSKTEDKESHGIGLWQVSRILKKHNNAILETSKNDKFFKQELVIYY